MSATESTPMPTLRIGEPAFTAHIESYAWADDTQEGRGAHYKILWFVSLVGKQDSVKAVWAMLVKGETGRMYDEDGRGTFVRLAPAPIQHLCKNVEQCRGKGKCKPEKGYWKSHTASLRNAAAFQLALLPEPARLDVSRHDYLILPESDETAPYWHMRFARKRLPTPLHASWEAWLWDRGRRRGEIVRLDGEGILAYRCTPNVEMLGRDVSAAVRRGELFVADSKRDVSQFPGPVRVAA